MERTVRGGERLAYSAAVTDLWERVGTALTRLERIAESPPDDLVDAHVDELPGLQYSLHAGAELALGIDAPPTAASLHSELVAALGVEPAEGVGVRCLSTVEGVDKLIDGVVERSRRTGA